MWVKEQPRCLVHEWVLQPSILSNKVLGSLSRQLTYMYQTRLLESHKSQACTNEKRVGETSGHLHTFSHQLRLLKIRNKWQCMFVSKECNTVILFIQEWIHTGLNSTISCKCCEGCIQHPYYDEYSKSSSLHPPFEIRSGFKFPVEGQCMKVPSFHSSRQKSTWVWNQIGVVCNKHDTM